jgi:cell division protein FtsI/penicillin-binding protein 2
VEASHQTSRAGMISGSAVLMNGEGEVLAVGNAPTANMDDAAELEQTLLEQRRHGEGRKAAERKVVNHAFLRALPVGSTQKIATSLALFRENRWPEQGATNACARHLAGYWIRTPRNRPPEQELLGGYDCNGDHQGVLPVGSLDSWHHAFRDSCDVYFGVAALGLTPGKEWALAGLSRHGSMRPGLSQGGGETAVIFDNADPTTQLRPGALDHPVPRDGNAYFETLLLLGFRFSSVFEGRGVNAQNVDDYDGIRYPTADHPWLPGLAPQAGFVYPTVAGFHSYSNAYSRGGVMLTPSRPVRMGREQPSVVRDHHWIQYLMTGWGQNITGNSLSIAASALPIVNAGGAMPQPRILAGAPARPGTPPLPLPPLVVDPATLAGARAELRAAMHDVVGHGTASGFFAQSPVLPMVGGKTGTIQIETSEPESAHAGQPDALRRALRYGCGVLNSSATQQDWDVVLAEYRRLFHHDSGWQATLPPEGFAEGSTRCMAAFNPGLPRSVMTATAAPLLADWDAFMHEERGEWRRRKVVSSAFVAVTLAPLVTTPRAQRGDPAGESWILGVIIDDRVDPPTNPVTAKRTAVAILESLQRYLEVRTQ